MIGAWNIEGYTEAKRVQLEATMRRRGIKALCVRGPWRPKADAFESETGYLVGLSGGAGEAEGGDRAVVGFVIDPGFRQPVVGFCQSSNRMS